MFKVATIGAFDVMNNIPYCKLAPGSGKVYNGNGVTIDRANATATLTTAETAKQDVWVLYNVVRGVYCGDREDAHWTDGDMPLLVSLASLVGREIEISNDAHTATSGPIASLTAGKYLVYGDKGLIKENANTNGYAYAYKIIEVSGDMIRAEVVEGTPAA